MHVVLLPGCNPRTREVHRAQVCVLRLFRAIACLQAAVAPGVGYENVSVLPVLQSAVDWMPMTDPNEIRALKASLRGALDTAAALAALQAKVDALDEHGDIAAEDLEELSLVTSGHAVASTALRGFVSTMQTRRAATS